MIINWPWATIHKIKCPDGTIKTYVKDIDKAFPLSIKEQNAKFNAEIEAHKQASANLSGEYASKIQGLLYNITEENKSIMIEFRTMYLGYQSDPCNNSKFLTRQIEKASKRQQKITELKIKIGGLISLASSQPENKSEFMNIYQDIVNRVKGSVKEAAKIEIEKNRQIATDWATNNIVSNG